MFSNIVTNIAYIVNNHVIGCPLFDKKGTIFPNQFSQSLWGAFEADSLMCIWKGTNLMHSGVGPFCVYFTLLA
jgi:hypothetical protein